MSKLKTLLILAFLSIGHNAHAQSDSCTKVVDSAITENAELIKFLKQRIQILTDEKEALVAEGVTVERYREKQLVSIASVVTRTESKHAQWLEQRKTSPDCTLLSDNTIQNIIKGSVY